MKRSTVAATLGLSLALALGSTGWAGATIPSGNLLANPGGDQGVSAQNSTNAPVPAGWTRGSTFSPGGGANNVTVVDYGTPGGFLTSGDAFAYGGGRSFFTGGPSSTSNRAQLEQQFDVSTIPEIAAGQVQASFGGCFGGYADQNDWIRFYYLRFNGGSQQGLGSGPLAAERGNVTKLLPRDNIIAVPNNTTSITFGMEFGRQSGSNTYNDAYADNTFLVLSQLGTARTTANCGSQGGGGQGGGGDKGGGSKGGGGGSSLLSRVGRTARLSHGVIIVPLRCLAHDPCNGRLVLTVPRLPAAARAVTLGAARFSIRPGRLGKVRVKLNRRARRRLKRLSRRRLGRVKVTVRTTIGKSTSKSGLRLRR